MFSLKNLSSLQSQCVDVVRMISNFGSSNIFDIIQSVSIQNLGHSELPYSICQVSDDHIFISYTHASAVYRYNSRGDQIWRIYVENPLQLCVNDYQLFVASYSNDTIYVISFDGVILREITTRRPMAITFDSYRKHLVVFSKSSLLALDENGKEKWTRDYESPGSSGYFLTFDKKTSNIFLSFYRLSEFAIFNADGVLLNEFNFMQRYATISNAAVMTPLDEFLILCEGNIQTLSEEKQASRSVTSLFGKANGGPQSYLCVFKNDGTLKRIDNIRLKNCVFNSGLKGQLIFADRFYIHFVC